MQPYFFIALRGLWLGQKYQSLCYQLQNLFKNTIFLDKVLKVSEVNKF